MRWIEVVLLESGVSVLATYLTLKMVASQVCP